MRNLIIITGDLASGKSTLAASLSNELGILCLTKDRLKEIACDAIGFSTREENRQLSVTAVNSMLYAFEQVAKVGLDVILEANFREEELLQLKSLTQDYLYNVALIMLTGDDHLLYQRFLDRLSNRHRAHTSLHLDTSFEKFREYLEEGRRQFPVFPANCIDMTEADEDEVVNEALDIAADVLGI